MTKILRNHIIHEFAGVCYENPDLYHERHDKRSRWDHFLLLEILFTSMFTFTFWQTGR